MFKINGIDDIKAIRYYYEDCLINISCSSSLDEIENELNKALEVYKTLENNDKKIVLAILIDSGYSLSETLDIFKDGRYTYIEANTLEDLGHFCFECFYENMLEKSLSDEGVRTLKYYIDFKRLGEDYEINNGLTQYEGYFIGV